MTLLRYKVPERFWDDHCDRCPCDGDPQEAMANEVSRAGRRVLIEGTEAQIETLRSDAKFYADPWGPDELPLGLKASAKATVKALETPIVAAVGKRTPAATQSARA